MLHSNHYAYCNNRPFEYCDPVGGFPFLLTGDVHFGVVEFVQGWFAERKEIDSDRKKLTGLEGQLPELAQYSRDGRAGMARALVRCKRLQEESAILENDGLIPAGSTDAIYRDSMQGVRGIHQLVEAGIDINRRDAANLQAPISIALMVAPLPFKGGIGRGIVGATEGLSISSSGSPAIGNSAISLTSRQAALLDQLGGVGASTLVHKSAVSLADLSALTAKTGREFGMFTLGSRRLVYGGGPTNLGLSEAEIFKNALGGWRFSATHILA